MKHSQEQLSTRRVRTAAVDAFRWRTRRGRITRTAREARCGGGWSKDELICSKSAYCQQGDGENSQHESSETEEKERCGPHLDFDSGGVRGMSSEEGRWWGVMIRSE